MLIIVIRKGVKVENYSYLVHADRTLQLFASSCDYAHHMSDLKQRIKQYFFFIEIMLNIWSSFII